jgi:chromosome segregation ATPase
MARPSAVERVRTALIDRDEALQQARGDLEKARTVAADWEADVVSVRAQHRQVRELDGELIALSNSNADQRRTLEDQRATVISLQLVVEGRRQALEGERKQVEGELSFRSFVLLIFPSAVCSLLDFLCSWYPSLRTALGHVTDRAETLQAAYDSAERELVELRAAALKTCQAVEEGEARAGSSLASRLRALGGHVSRCMRRALHLGI